jgi:formylglycine-generating enzyme required for sulfatase activity
MPIVTHPQPDAAGAAGPCPLGAKLLEGKPRVCIDLYEYPGGKTIPRTKVSFESATRLCASRGERLCTEPEWERACRGKGNSSFPYGHVFDPARCNTKGTGEVAPAGRFKDCRSASGAYDMSGNVAEWVIGRDKQPAHKGGSVQTSGRDARCSHTERGVPRDGDTWVGFRCCADPR